MVAAGVARAGQSGGQQARGRQLLAIWGTVTALVVAVAGAALWLIERGERDAVDATEVRVQRFVSGAEAALNRTMIEIDLLLVDMGEISAPGGTFERGTAERTLRGAVSEC
jgi:hypothetical protein